MSAKEAQDNPSPGRRRAVRSARGTKRSEPARPRRGATRGPAPAWAEPGSAAPAGQVDLADVAREDLPAIGSAKGDSAPVVVETKPAARKTPGRRKRTETSAPPAAATIGPRVAVAQERVAVSDRARANVSLAAESVPKARTTEGPAQRRGTNRGRGRGRGKTTQDAPNLPTRSHRPPGVLPRHVEDLPEPPLPQDEGDAGVDWDEHDLESGASARSRRFAADSAEWVEEVDEGEREEFLDDEPGGERRGSSRRATKQMLINVSGGDECRVAVLADNRLEELFIERASAQSHVGNIYKGRVTNVEPSIQAVFVDFGLKKNGFLHISDVQPQYFPNHDGRPEEVGRKIPRHERPPIQKCFRRGQELIVQVTKEGVGTKGPTLTTYLSIPGRFLVMMPGMHRHGVSRKIEDDAARRRMRDVMNELDLPAGMGFILRTAGMERTKRELQRDLHYLMRLWRTVVDRIRRLPTPAELYKESDLVTRAIRDIYTPEFERVILDDAETARRAQEFLQIAMPRAKTTVELYSAREPLFHRYGIEDEIERINSRHVPLPSGGSLVIDSTEALVAIDVNSGKFRSIADAEETAYRINIEAAEEIARQLRLRDLGGLILCDFIDMRQERHKRAVERALRDALKKHKERARILRMSAFGIIEMTRQRQGPSIKRNIYYDCPHCKGSGLVKMPESVMLDVMRMIQLATHHEPVQKVTIVCAADVAMHILNGKRALLSQIETETGKAVLIRGDSSYRSDQVVCQTEDAAGRPVVIEAMSTDGILTKPVRERLAT